MYQRLKQKVLLINIYLFLQKSTNPYLYDARLAAVTSGNHVSKYRKSKILFVMKLTLNLYTIHRVNYN